VETESPRQQLTLSLLAVLLGLIVGGILMLTSGANPLTAYRAMLRGAFGGSQEFGRTLEKATPLILAGLAVAFALKAGLFNIGGQGQLLVGAAFSAWAGFRFDMPAVIHVPFALLVGAAAASVLGFIVGILKATRGVHEVISTIMLNFVAANFTDWLASRDGPWNDPTGGAIARTPKVAKSAEIPRLADLPLGFAVAVGAAVLIWWIVSRTTLGFDVVTTGRNPNAAKYSGISVVKITVITMMISAALAGLGGAIETQGVVGRFEPGFNRGIGFDGITIALLARTNPLAVIPAALLIGAMDAGSSLMQSKSGVEPEIISIIQAVILLLVAAPSVVRWIVHRRSQPDQEPGQDQGPVPAGLEVAEGGL
jgi:simple sugar transport system permease protein